MIIGRLKLKKGRITNREKTRTKETKPMFVPIRYSSLSLVSFLSFFLFFFPPIHPPPFAEDFSLVHRFSVYYRALSPPRGAARGKRKRHTKKERSGKRSERGFCAVADSISRGTLPISDFPLPSSSLVALTAAQLTIFIMYNIYHIR